ncbi:excalibur calcium-binding domain-containing protein [Rhodococcus sp. KRD162]|uniref:excalibur calcium-binding domain-containing protein n=1 Tax=Rhodococcus sp. KRD162 TaxID=2729725 RepID=UPI0027DCF6EA|nr:excalibur calcium-binding domain-containing protein [Rhodococcus sp. KRD162]
MQRWVGSVLRTASAAPSGSAGRARSCTTAPRPAPQPQGAPAPAPRQGGAFEYKNCDAARAAGAAPVYRGDYGYGPHLDRDNDGIGCE